MALTECPECRKQVSTRAEACPHCGLPLKETHVIKYYRRRVLWQGKVGWAALLLGMVAAIVSALTGQYDFSYMAGAMIIVGGLLIGVSAIRTGQIDDSGAGRLKTTRESPPGQGENRR